MIFVGCNHEIVFPRYYDHHSRLTDSRIVPVPIRRWWNKLKRKDFTWQVLEYHMKYGKPYCQECMRIFVGSRWNGTYDGINDPTYVERQKIVDRRNSRF